MLSLIALIAVSSALGARPPERGAYFYRIETRGFSAARKMVLLR